MPLSRRCQKVAAPLKVVLSTAAPPQSTGQLGLWEEGSLSLSKTWDIHPENPSYRNKTNSRSAVGAGRASWRRQTLSWTSFG